MEHTSKHYEQELKNLREKILVMGGKVEQMLAQSMNALVNSDVHLAKEVVAQDRGINELEREIDELCFNILALRQPTASDLRFIIMSQKIVTDLERMGDLGVNIAERTLDLVQEPALKPYVHLPILGQMAQSMMKTALDAFVNADANLAQKVLKDDDAVDELTHQLLDDLQDLMHENSANINRALRLSYVAKYLERLADHATNIAEMVLFMIRGEDVRHRSIDTVLH